MQLSRRKYLGAIAAAAGLGYFGSEYDMSFFESMTKSGTKFNNFDVTAVSAFTRACLFSGRNTHSVGVGNIAEWAQQGEPWGERLANINLLGSELSQPAKVALGNQSLGGMLLPKLCPIYTPNSGIRFGENLHAPISRAHTSPFKFNQTLKRVPVAIEMS